MDRLCQYDPDLLDIEGIGKQTNLATYADTFFSQGVTNASVDVNANVRSTNVYTFINEFPKVYLKQLSLYFIWKRMAEMFSLKEADEFVKQEITGGIYVHDLFHSAFMPYCYAYSLGEICRNGLQFIENIHSIPAKHLNTFIQHVIQFVMFASNQSSGAVGLPDLFVWMWYYVKKDIASGYIPKENWATYVRQMFQVFTYSINQPIRGTQSPYVNITYLDRNYIRSIFENEVYPDGSKIVDDIEDIITLQKMYWEWISQEREKQMFTFPVMTASLLYKDGKFVDEDSARFINRINLKWQDTNWYISDSIDAVASCCRLQSSMKAITFSNKLTGVSNSIGGSDLNIGSFKVVTLNLPRIAIEARGSISKFFAILKERTDLVMKTLAVIRSILQDRINQGVLPLYTHKLVTLERQYGTLGITGIWETAYLMSKEMVQFTTSGAEYTKRGQGFVATILDTLNEAIEDGRYKYGFTFNIEQIPAEKAAAVLAEKDKICHHTNFKLYSNQWVPMTIKTDILNRIEYSGMWDSKVNGGAILHINLDVPISDDLYMWEFVNKIAQMGVKYFAFNTKISVCADGHAFYGTTCPICGQPATDYFTRIVGYLVPSKAFNKMRKEYDLPKRQFYKNH